MFKTKLSVVAVLVTALCGTSMASGTGKIDQKFIDESSYALGIVMGKNLEGLVEAQKSMLNYNQDQIIAGVKDALKKSGKLTEEDLRQQLEALDNFLREQELKIQAEKDKVTLEAGEKFRADYAKKSGVKKTDSGLLYKIEKPGKGESPKKEDMVKVHYKGTLTDGTVFDSSFDRGEPIEFQLQQLIPGWVEAIPMLKKGGKMELVIPPQLGYGDRQAGKIPAHSTLIFEIELIDFKAADK